MITLNKQLSKSAIEEIVEAVFRKENKAFEKKYLEQNESVSKRTLAEFKKKYGLSKKQIDKLQEDGHLIITTAKNLSVYGKGTGESFRLKYGNVKGYSKGWYFYTTPEIETEYLELHAEFESITEREYKLRERLFAYRSSTKLLKDVPELKKFARIQETSTALVPESLISDIKCLVTHGEACK